MSSFFTQNEEGPSALASPLDPPLTPALKWPYSPALSKVYVFVYDVCDLFNKLTSFLCFCPLVDGKFASPHCQSAWNNEPQPSGSAGFDNVMTKFIINKRTDA